MELIIIKKKIFEIRGHRVMLDRDLAEMYSVETRVLVQAVKRNINRFPEDFMFQITKREFQILISQTVTSSWGGTRKLPFAFTEHGVAMLSSVLKSNRAVEVNLSVIRAFIVMRQLATNHEDILKKIKELEEKYDKNFDEIYEALNSLINPPKSKHKKMGYRDYDEN